jgi:hypothetical protein
LAELRKAGKIGEPEVSGAAQSGTRIHRAWNGEEAELNDFETQTLDNLRRLEDMVVANWVTPCRLFGREMRLWYHERLIPRFSGAIDVVYISLDERRALILDGKTMTGQVDPAHCNDQLRELVALFHYNYPAVTQVDVAILSPNMAQRISQSYYDEYALRMSLELLCKHLQDIEEPNRPRTPGDYCKYCPCVAHCPEALDYANDTLSLGERVVEGRLDLPLGEAGSALVTKLLVMRPLVERLLATYKQVLLDKPDALPGYHLKDGKSVREITDILAAWELARNVEGLELDAFLSAAKLSVTKLEKAFGAASGQKGRNLRSEFDQLFDAVIKIRTDSPELERDRSLKEPF